MAHKADYTGQPEAAIAYASEKRVYFVVPADHLQSFHPADPVFPRGVSDLELWKLGMPMDSEFAAVPPMTVTHLRKPLTPKPLIFSIPLPPQTQ
jgi:hypothetical protein